MTIFNEKEYLIGTAEYGANFWNAMRGIQHAYDKIHGGANGITGGYALPSGSNEKLQKAITQESLLRSMATVIKAYNGASRIFAKDYFDIAAWVPEGGSIPLQDGVNNFTRHAVDSHKLAVFVKLDDDFVHDAAFSLEDYLTERLARNFAKAEDAAFLNGNGVDAPTGILNSDTSATVGVSTDALTFDSVIRLFFALDPDYRKNAVWMMNDETALALRLLKDDDGNHIWNHTDSTILGKPVVIANDMPSVGSGNTPILFADFSYYWIICRSPVSVRTLKEKFVTLDQIGYLALEFMDAKLVRRDAVQALKIA